MTAKPSRRADGETDEPQPVSGLAFGEDKPSTCGCCLVREALRER